MKNCRRNRKNITALAVSVAMLLNTLPTLNTVSAEVYGETFESGETGAFICDKSGGVNVCEKSGNHYIKISPAIDGLSASAAYPVSVPGNSPVDISLKFMLCDWVIDNQTILDLSYDSISNVVLKISDGKLVCSDGVGRYVTVLSNLVANKWYNLKVSVDYQKKTFNVYIDGKERVYGAKTIGNDNQVDTASFIAQSAPGFCIDDFFLTTTTIPEKIEFTGEKEICVADGLEKEVSFEVYVTDKNGLKITDAAPAITLSPSDAGVTYNYSDNKITLRISALAPEGEYTLCAALGSIEEYFRFDLKRYAPQVAQIKITGEPRLTYFKDVREEQTYEYRATAYDQEGNEINGVSFSYFLSGENIPSGVSFDPTAGRITLSSPVNKETQITISAEAENNYGVSGTKTVILQDEDTYWGDKVRFEILLNYIDRVRELGRDPWNGSPLIAMAIDRYTMKPATWRSENKTYVPTNLANQANWFRTLEGIYNLTGDEQYKKEITDTYQFYIDKFKLNNGFFPWGGHMYVDMRDLSVVGEDIIEFKSQFPYFTPYWELDPEGARKHVMSQFRGSFSSWSQFMMNRHINPRIEYSEGEYNSFNTLAKPIDKNEYGLRWVQTGDMAFRTVVNDLVYLFGDLYDKTEEEAAAKWAYRLLQSYFACTDPETKLAVMTYTSRKDMVTNIPGERDDSVVLDLRDDLLEQGYINQWQYDNICIDPFYLFSCSDIYNTYSDIKIAKQFGIDSDEGYEILDYHLTSMASFAKYAYNPEDDSCSRILVDGTNFDGLLSINTAAKYWTARGSVQQPYDMTADHWLALVKTYIECNEYSDKFRTQLGEIWSMARNHARHKFMGEIGRSGPGDDVKVDCSTSQDDPNYIIGLCMLYKETGDTQYLNLARRIADNIIKNNMVQGLFTHDIGSHYISLAGRVGAYVYGFALLEATILGEYDALPEYFPCDEAIDDKGYKEDTGEFKDEINVDSMWYNYQISPVRISSIDIPMEEITMKVGEEKYLDISIEPDDATDTSLNIVSSNPSCVAFNYDDRSITALKKGSAKIQIVVTNKRWIKKTLTVNVVE